VASGSVGQISFSPNSRLFAVSAVDQSATLWDLGSRKRVGNTFPIETSTIPVVLFEASGDLAVMYLASGAEWPTDLRSWRRFACKVAGRDLTPVEWNEVLPDRPYQHVCPV
jgi:hypothetical protein